MNKADVVKKILACKGDLIYLQNQDAEVFLDFVVHEDSEGNTCLSLFEVEQKSEWPDRT